MPWYCIKCDARYEDRQTHCEIDDTPRLFTRTEVEAIHAEAHAAAAQVVTLCQQLQQKEDEIRRLQERLKTALARRPTPPLSGKVPKPVGQTAGPSVASLLVRKNFKNSLGMEFVLLPAGSFQMGSNEKETHSDEKPVHEVRLTKPFYLGIHAVTQGQWQAVMEHNPSRFKGEANLPVENVSWNDVQQFITALNAVEGQGLYRLPTEAEWEYAARAGTTTAYSFGNDIRQLGEYAWYEANSGGKTHSVGQKKPNPWGLYDMHGNVWEWVEDWYGPYKVGSAEERTAPASDAGRVYRGGSWFSRARNCRSTHRSRNAPVTHSTSLGFRLARTVQNVSYEQVSLV